MRQVLCLFLGLCSMSHLPKPATSSSSPRVTLDSSLGLGQSCPPTSQKGSGVQRAWSRRVGSNSYQNHPDTLYKEPEIWVLSPESLMFFKLPSWHLCGSSGEPLALMLTLIVGGPRKVVRVLSCDLWRVGVVERGSGLAYPFFSSSQEGV